MKSRLLLVLALALAAVGCSSSSDELSTDDAYRHYVAPTICKKASECLGSGLFMTVYAGGLDECVNKAIKGANVSNQLSGCTNAQYKTCVADYAAAMCPTDLAKSGGLPATPASCSGCAF